MVFHAINFQKRMRYKPKGKRKRNSGYMTDVGESSETTVNASDCWLSAKEDHSDDDEDENEDEQSDSHGAAGD